MDEAIADRATRMGKRFAVSPHWRKTAFRFRILLVNDFLALFSRFDLLDAVDVLLVTIVFYAVLRLFAGTQGVQVLRGALVLVLLGVLASTFTVFSAFSWLIRNSGLAILIAIPVVFQPELRRLLERLGRTGLLFLRSQPSTGTSQLINELVTACMHLSQQRHGAIIVLEGQTGLQDSIETGVPLGAIVTAELLETVFYPGTPLHDGAVILREQTVMAAACVLPLTSQPLADTSLGTRHRAGIGITEGTDALALIVSEETGVLSAARNGRLVRRLDDRRLRRVLEQFYNSRAQSVHLEEDALPS
jgi:diadenylate cyclase